MQGRRNKALVVGGSIAGLYAARLLARQGWDITVFERAAGDLRARGAGIATHPETFSALQHAGLDPGPEIGISVQRRRVLDRDGAFVHDVPHPQVMASWASLYALLRDDLEAVALRGGKSLVGATQGASGVAATFDDGTEFCGDILVGADGLRSTVRQLFMPKITPLYTGYIAWRGMAPEERLTNRTRNRVFEEFCFCLPPGEQMAGYPVLEAVRPSAASRRAYNFIWYRPVAACDLHHFLTDANGTRHEMNVPPPLVHPRIIADMRAAADALLSPEFVEIISAVDEPFYQPIFDMTVPAMVCGRIALVGDAAFVARPHVGAGVTKAFDDGKALAHCLADSGVDVGLARFDAERRPIDRRIVERGRELGAIMGDTGSGERSRWREMMIGSATLDFLTEEHS